MTPPPAVSVRGLRKSYGEHTVLDGVDLTVPAGTVLALLGPNGAGKTTAVRILSTLIPADGGDIRVAGHDPAREPDAVRAAIGVTGQFSAVDGLLTGRENLRLMARLHHLPRTQGRERAEDLLRRFDLQDAADRSASSYSGGMRRRLDLAMTLVATPRIVFLDEPTAGLDPRSRRDLWEIIRELVADGVTIFLTTQYLDEADRLADDVAVLDGGRLVAQGSPARLKDLVPGGHIRLRVAPDDLAAATGALPEAVADPADPGAITVDLPGDGAVVTGVRDLLARLDAARIPVAGLRVHTPDLDDVFLALTDHRPTDHRPTDHRPTDHRGSLAGSATRKDPL